MAIKRRMLGQRRTAVREFTDRIDPREAFWNRYDKMISEGTTIITYYGAGGLGKTSLINELMNELDRKNLSKVKYIYHDFINGLDMRSILKHWKNTLENFGCEFPLFETGDFYLSLKQGAKDVEAPQMKPWLQRNKWMTAVKDKLELGDYLVDNAIPGMNAAATIADFSSEALSIFPGVKTFSALFKVVDKIMGEHEFKNRLETHSEIRDQLKQKFEARNSAELYEFLPLLFAQDVRDWQQSSEEKLIIFLDTYELLTGGVSDENQLNENNLYRDWWIRDDIDEHLGLIFTIPNVLWVISGRNKIRWTGELEEELDQHLLKRLSYDDSNYFLKTAEVEDQNLRDGIINLTEGYPLYLDICVDTYERILALGKTPTLDNFGQNREQIINRLLKYMDDDICQMVQCLCLLGTWTDYMAHDIVIGYDVNNYIKTKKFSFIQQKFVTLDDEEIEVFSFDRTLQKFIIESIKSNSTLRMMIDHLQGKVNIFFERMLDKIDGETFFFYLKRWSEIILTLTDDAQDLMDQYEKYLEANVAFINSGDDQEDIVEPFFNKIKQIAKFESAPYAYFEHCMGLVKSTQSEDWGIHNLDKIALQFEESAYNKFKNLYTEENKYTLAAMVGLARALNNYGRKKEEIDLREKIVKICEHFYGKSENKTIEAMKELAECLSDRDSESDKKRALELRQQILELLTKNHGENDEKVIVAMKVLAYAFEDEGLSKKALPLRRNIVKFYRQNKNIYELTWNIRGLIEIVDAEEALELQRELLAIYKETDSSWTVDEMGKLADMLENLDRLDEAETLRDEMVQIRKSAVDESIDKFSSTDERTVRAIEDLILTLESVNRNAEAAEWQKKKIDAQRQLVDSLVDEFGEDDDRSIEAMDKLAQILERGDAQIEVRQRIVNIMKCKYPADDDRVLQALKCLAYAFDDSKFSLLHREKEAADTYREIFDIVKRKYDEDSDEFFETIQDLSNALFIANRYEEALELRKKVLDILENAAEPNEELIIDQVEIIAHYLSVMENYDEEVNYRKRVVEFYENEYDEDHEETIYKIEKLIEALQRAERTEESLEWQNKILELTENNLSEESEEFIDKLWDAADEYSEAEEYEKELEIRQRIVALFKKMELERVDVSNWYRDFDSAVMEVVNLLHQLDREDEAMQMRNQILDVHNERLDKLIKKFETEKNSEVIDEMEKIADILQGFHLYDEELEMRQRIFKNISEMNSADSEEGIEALEKIAAFYDEHEQSNEALKIRKDIVEAKRRNLKKSIDKYGDTHEDAIKAMKDLAQDFYQTNQPEEAGKIELQIVEIRKKIVEQLRTEFSADNSETIEAMYDWARALDKVENYAEELEIYQQILGILQKKDDINKIELFDPNVGIAHSFEMLGEFEKALPYRQQAYEIISNEYGEYNWRTDQAMDNLAFVLEKLERYEEAVTWREKLLETYPYTEHLSEVEIVEVKYNLARTLHRAGHYEEAIEAYNNTAALFDEIDSFKDNELNIFIQSSKYARELLHELGRFDEEIIPLQTIANLWYEIHWGLNDEKKLEAIDAINEVIAMLESLDRQDEIQDWQDKISEIESDSEEDDITEDDEEDFDNDDEDEVDDEENFEDETEDMDDELSETSEIDTSESINLLQGQRLNLASENLSIVFDFENANTPDVFIFLLNDTGKVSGDDDMIFYNNPKNESESVEILEDEIKIDLLKMLNVVKKAVIAIAFDDNKNFDDNESTIHLIDESERKELFSFQFGKSLNTEKAIVVGEIYKHNDKWKFKTVGAGFNGGLAKLCEHFDVEVE